MPAFVEMPTAVVICYDAAFRLMQARKLNPRSLGRALHLDPHLALDLGELDAVVMAIPS